MNREHYFQDYPVDPPNYSSSRLPQNNFLALNSTDPSLLPPPLIHTPQQYYSEFSHYQPFTPAYDPSHFESKYVGNYDDRQIFWRGYETNNQPVQTSQPPNQPNIV